MKKTDPGKNLFPVLLDLSHKRVVLVSEGGSDREALKIARMLHPCTSHFTVLTLSASGVFEQLAKDGHVTVMEKQCGPEDLYDADYLFSTLRSGRMNDEIHALCRTLGVRLFILSQPGRSDFLLPLSEEERSPAMVPSEEERPSGEKEFIPVSVYTDGAARGNPDGPGGYGAVIEYVDSAGTLHTKELSQGYIKTTNNRMELMAAICALEALTKPCRVELWSDSRYLVSAFNEHWIDSWIKKGWMRTKNEPVRNVDLWQRLLRAAGRHQVSWNWVKGHSGHEKNERCDALATAAADSPDLIPDPGISNSS